MTKEQLSDLRTMAGQRIYCGIGDRMSIVADLQREGLVSLKPGSIGGATSLRYVDVEITDAGRNVLAPT